MKKFHIQGPCLAHKHYMADISTKVAAIMKLIEEGNYFAISRPRQYGKTTTMYAIARYIQAKEDYLAIPISLEGIGTLDFEDETNFCVELTALIAEKLFLIDEHLYERMNLLFQKVDRLSAFSRALTKWLKETPHKVVLLIDEVDQSSKHDVFLRFLAVLRNKYIQTEHGLDTTFYSVVLVGVHDIKNLKMKIRSDAERKLNSPWNIAAEFKVNMSLQAHEIMPMLEEYVTKRKIKMDIPTIAQQLYAYTSGYPFLVSKICKVVDEDILPQKKIKTWTKSDLGNAVHQIIHENNFNFDSLIKNLEHHKDVYKYVFDLLVEGIQPAFSIQHPVIQLGLTYGILRNGQGINIHNRIYEQIIYNYMIFELENRLANNDYGPTSQYIHPDKSLNLDKVLLNFQKHMKEQYNERDKSFLERNGRLVFLSFLKPIINGKGHTFVEPQISEEKRLDIVITFYHHKYIIELKMWYGVKTHDKGLLQLVDYLDRQEQNKGWLVIFEHRRKKTWSKKLIQKKGKDIFAVWV